MPDHHSYCQTGTGSMMTPWQLCCAVGPRPSLPLRRCHVSVGCQLGKPFILCLLETGAMMIYSRA